MQNQIKDEVQAAVELIYHKHVKTDDINVEVPGEKKHGNFATNISFVLAGELKKDPAEIASTLANEIAKTGAFERVEAVGGFVNFYLSSEKYHKMLAEILERKEKYGKSKLLSGKKIQVEFISANPTGPLHLGNSRGGYPGVVLANVLAWAGAKVEREYYLNNGGNQVKILGESILASAGLSKKSEDLYRGDYIENWVKKHSAEVKKFKDDPFTLGQKASADIVKEYIQPAVKKMGIKFDKWFSEAELIKAGEVEKILKLLEDKKLIYEKDGAKWFRATKFGDEKDRVAVKSDGSYTYFAGDAAYHWNKFAVRKFDQVINIWGADHHGDVMRVMGAVEGLGFGGKLSILLTQFVRLVKNGKEYKMSKRKGTYVTFDDLLNLIGGTEKEASDVARFFFLSRSIDTHMDFDLDLAREHSEKNPVFYVKYAYARIHGILAKSKLQKEKYDLGLLTDPAELELIEQLAQLPSLVEFIATSRDYPVHDLTFYILDTAKKFHYFYDKCRVIDDANPKLSAARLALVNATKTVLGIVGRDLIGIEMPEKM